MPVVGIPLLIIGKKMVRGIGSDERPSTTWFATGYAMSGLGFAAGTWVLAAAGSVDKVNLGIGIGTLAISAAGLAINLYAHLKTPRERGEKRSGVTLVPILAKSRDGGVVAGLGIRVLQF